MTMHLVHELLAVVVPGIPHRAMNLGSSESVRRDGDKSHASGRCDREVRGSVSHRSRFAQACK